MQPVKNNRDSFISYEGRPVDPFFLVGGVRNDSVRFIVIGDWGGLPDFPYRTPVEKAVGREMGKIADYLDTQFVLALGDNFYFDGVKDVADSRFKVSNMNRFKTQSEA